MARLKVDGRMGGVKESEKVDFLIGGINREKWVSVVLCVWHGDLLNNTLIE